MWFLVTLTLIAAGDLFGMSEWGHLLERHTHDFLQLRLARSRPAAELPIVIVDIHDFEIDTQADNPHTSRAALQSLVWQLAKARPLAIGIDIDFSPEADGTYVSPADDPSFFEFCRTLTDTPDAPGGHPIPVYLGVGRGASGASFRWLGDLNYQNLAASILIPEDPLRIPRELRHVVRAGTWRAPLAPNGDAIGEPGDLPSMAFALATSVNPELSRTLAAKSRFTEMVLTRALPRVQGIALSEFWIDAGGIPELERTTISVGGERLPTGALERIKNKVVLIGDPLVGDEDTFHTIVQRETSGLYIHAAAALTLLEKPLRTFTSGTRHAVDFGMSLVSVLVVLFASRKHTPTFKTRLEWLLTAIVCAAVALFAVGLWKTRILWFDFVLVIMTSLIHQPASRLADRLAARFGVGELHKGVEA